MYKNIYYIFISYYKRVDTPLKIFLPMNEVF